MQNQIIPEFTDFTVVGAAATAAMGSIPRRLLVNFSAVAEGTIHVTLAKGGPTQPGVAPVVAVRPLLNANASKAMAGRLSPIISLSAVITGTPSGASVNIDSPAGAYTLFCDSANFAIGDIISIASPSLDQFEVHRVSATIASGVVLDSPLAATHLATVAANVRNKCEQWSVDVRGGRWYEVVIDGMATTTGSPMLSAVAAQGYTSSKVQRTA